MADAKKSYRKLPGWALNLFGVTRLWQAEDHVLHVSAVAGFESYRRYYFREIKALIVQPTSTGLVWNVVFGFLLTFFALGGYGFWVARTARQFPVGVAVMGGLAAFVAVLLLINVLRGKTCRFFVQTKAGVERLGAPVRVPAARRVRALLAAKILAEQAPPVSPAGFGAEEARAGAAQP